MKCCVIPGDGIGPEVVSAAVEILHHFFPKLQIENAVAGWGSFQDTGEAVPPLTLDKVRACGAALFGAVSSPAYPVDGYKSAVVTLRKQLDLYANLRPVQSSQGDVDLIIFRENSEGLYAGRESLSADGQSAVAERHISKKASSRIARKAGEVAIALGRKKITIVHKANVMPISDGLFRDTVKTTLLDCASHIEVDELLADIAAFWLLRDPGRFDVIVTTNLFGDILSDAAAHWGGGMGLVPSLNWGDNIALAEPVHGSAPDLAGRGVANPMATILSAALLVRYHWRQPKVAGQIEAAVRQTVLNGPHTPDLGGQATTRQVTKAILDRCADLQLEN